MACVVAVNATADGNRAVAIGAGKIHAQADFVDAGRECFFEHAVQCVIAPGAPTLQQSGRKIHGGPKRVNKKALWKQAKGRLAPRLS
jgi:hypothetical protein